MTQELIATVEFMKTLRPDQIAPFVDEPMRSASASIKRIRIERDAARKVLEVERHKDT